MGVRVFVLTIQSAYPVTNPWVCARHVVVHNLQAHLVSMPPVESPCVLLKDTEGPTERETSTVGHKAKRRVRVWYSWPRLWREEGETERKRKRRRERAREKVSDASNQLWLLLLFRMDMAESLFPFLSPPPTHGHN